jgi:CRP-like cAMP-binding protein
MRIPGPGNAILASLPARERRIVRDSGMPVELRAGTVLFNAGDRLDAVYFLTGGLVSLLGSIREGPCVEIGIVGREGCVGLPLLLGADRQQHRAVVQQDGMAYRVPAALFRRHRLEHVRRAGIRYAHLRMIELSQSAVCNQFHSLQQRLCRWLLSARLRTDGAPLRLTQDMLSQILGAARPAVNILLHRLERMGAVGGRRGIVTVLHRVPLQHSACECYRVVRKEFDAYVSHLSPT